MRKQLFLLFILTSSTFLSVLQAQIKLPGIISDNMILQQKEKAALWGWAAPQGKIQNRLFESKNGG